MKSEDRSIRLLLVDDDELSREVLNLQISAQGYAVHMVESGEAALEYLGKITTTLPDAVLTDLRMPGISGIPLSRRIRAISNAEAPPRMVLLAMSASHPDEDLFGSYDGFLLKPFTMLQLAEALQLNPAVVPARTTRSGSHHRAATTARLEEAAIGLDRAVNSRFADSMSAARLQEFYAMCLEDAEARIDRMRVAATKGDDAEYRRQAHTIKGSCSMVGAIELQRLAALQETRGIDPANHVASLDEMMGACGRLRRILIAREDRATE